ncbi:MAG: hypothetical protein P9L92_15450, partial [Candidatus Electryonea clarkiae]|nr:hypothetical protein [Candidatus Electryonea clarkiae]
MNNMSPKIFFLQLFLFFLITYSIQAQVSFVRHAVDGNIGARSIKVEDLDSDGDNDIIAAIFVSDRHGDPYGDAIIWLENDGEMDFTCHVLTDNYPNALAICSADLDGDDDVDIISGAATINGLRWWENDGDYPPEFTENNIILGFRREPSIAAVDLDNDFDIDIVGRGEYSDEIVWFENDGNADFTEHIIGDDHYLVSVNVADINGDDYVDIVSSAGVNRVLRVYYNDTDQSPEFNSEVIARNNSGIMSVYISDFDLDGDPDILAGNNLSVDWYQNNSSEEDVFIVNSLYDGINSLVQEDFFIATDLDNDGDVDLTVRVDDRINQTRYLLNMFNNGLLEFTEVDTLEPDNLSALFSMDIDFDGDIDIISSNPITWWENNQDPVANASIEGYVRIEESDETVVGAEVVFGKFVAVTDENGYYEIDTAYSLPYTVLIRADGFARYIEPDFEIESGENISNFELSPAETTPAQFSLISPGSNSYFTTEYNQLTWQSSNDTDYGDSLFYDVYVQRSQIDSFYNPRITGLTDTFYTFQARGDSTWYWTVHARDTNSEGTWAGEVWSFVTFNVVSVEEEVFGIPQEYSIASLHPNPFNSRVKIVIGIPEQTDLIAEVYDILGRQIAVLFSGNVQ